MILAKEIVAVILSFIYVVTVLVVVEKIANKRKIDKEVTRKIIHILIVHYIFIVYFLIDSVWLAVIPSSVFIVVNIFSKKYNIITAMERENNDDSFGTIWYSLASTIVIICAYLIEIKEIAVVSLLILGYGDGFAALVGKKHGKHNINTTSKTIEGSMAMFFLTMIITFVYQYVVWNNIDLKWGLSACILITYVESIANRGLDNIFIPMMASVLIICKYLFHDFIPIIFEFSLIVLFVFVIWIVRALDFTASCLTLILMSVVFFCSGVLPLITIVLFLVSSSVVSFFSNNNKNNAKKLHKRVGERTSIQVLANGGITVLLSMVFYFTKIESIWFGIFVSLAVASSDTFSSELGMLSKKNPVSILSLKKMAPGLSGGVTLLGGLGSILGASIIASVFLVSNIKIFWEVLLFGVVGSLIDSVMGAMLQVKYITPDGTITENNVSFGENLEIFSGISWINNDFVNIVSILFSTTIAMVLYQVL